MTTFRYPRPEQEPSSPWSGFSDEAKTALTRMAMGPSPADQLLDPEGRNGEDHLSREVQLWAEVELENSLTAWGTYIGTLQIFDMPHTYTDVVEGSKKFEQTINKLYEAKQSLTESNEATPEEQNVGETMHLALVPWQEIRNHLTDFDQWVNTMRNAQGIAPDQDYINKDLLSAIKSDQPLYRDPASPFQLLTSTQYLDRKITEDGPWGIILVQTSPEAGIESIRGQSPNEMTHNGQSHFELAGRNVDALGIFEWVALTFEKNPQELSPQDVSWFLANRMDVDGVPLVPGGYWGGGRVGSYLDWAGRQNDNVRVRLAVM